MSMTTQRLARDITAPPVADIITLDGPPPVWSIDFTQQSPASAGLTFTRASQAGYYDPSGSWIYALTNTPRMTHHPISKQPLGLLIEETRTNVLLNSAAPTTQTVTLGTGTYTLWLEGSGNCTCAAGTATGTGFGIATSIKTITFTLTNAGSVIFTVNGSLLRFQCEAGTHPTSFITTTHAAATRAADTCTTNLSGIINPVEGTFIATGNVGTGMFMALDNGSGDGATRLHIKGGNTERNLFCSMGGSIKGTYSDFTPLPTGTRGCLGLSYGPAGVHYAINGQSVFRTDTPATGLSINTLRIGHRQLSGGLPVILNGVVHSIRYFNRALSREHLQALTK
ncbi:MAG: hypothetical protein DI628_06020 [Blastochloris viridis]|uniref:Uncharacterized protein n=1 Tax=Blastochloris viridis TaxID=1079 RepID=A0A6N4RBM6_BLAVI|nr:MAG: hypothetical protein DI628_06020 [Blastochloris viridis]